MATGHHTLSGLFMGRVLFFFLLDAVLLVFVNGFLVDQVPGTWTL